MLGKCSENEDKLIWKASKSGNFLMKSFLWMEECLFLGR